MVSAGIKITEFPNKHLVSIFFLTKPNQKDLADFININKLWIKH